MPTAGLSAPQPLVMHFPHLGSAPVPAPEPPPEAATTSGWDTVFAIRMPDVNRSIIKSGASPPGFNCTLGAHLTMQGAFGPWQVCRGGSGKLIHLTVPVTSGTLACLGQDYSLAGAVAIIEVRLHDLPQPDATAPATSETRAFKVNPAALGPSQPPVSVLKLTIPGALQDSSAGDIIAGALDYWFNASLADFTHIFASVALDRSEETGAFQWLAPRFTSYAWADGEDDESSALGILCMTTADSAPGLLEELSGDAIPDGARSALLIGKQLLMEKMLLPAMPQAFPDGQPGDFILSAARDRITNARAINLKPVDHNGSTYYPKLSSLDISIVGSEIVIASQTDVELSAGIEGHVKATHYVTIKLVTKADGTQTLAFENTRAPIVTPPWTTLSDGVIIAQVILAILAVIVAAIIEVVTAGAATLVALAIVGLVFGLAIAAPKIVAAVLQNQASDDVPSIDLLVLNSTGSIRWPDSREFKLTSATLNGCLQLGGDPQFTLDDRAPLPSAPRGLHIATP